MKRILGIEVTEEYFNSLFCEQSKGKEIKVKDGKLVAVEPSINQGEKDRYKMEKLLDSLSSTDYVANKLAEAVADYMLTGNNLRLQSLQEKYANILVQREQWRAEINELKEKAPKNI